MKILKRRKKKRINCRNCQGTGIGYIRADSNCGHCKGRGYFEIDKENSLKDKES